jgi:hypothetical protein
VERRRYQVIDRFAVAGRVVLIMAVAATAMIVRAPRIVL